MASVKVFLGVDGGGTGTRSVLVESSGLILGQGQAGPSNYHNVGLARAMENIQLATERAWADAGLEPQLAEAAFLGCAGIKSREDIGSLASAAGSAGIARSGGITVANDLHNALAGGLNGSPGIALIAGTGTNCLGRDATGASFMCGGWGWLLDDEGGGFGLAISAMRAATRAADGRAPATCLLPEVLDHFGLSEPNELLARLYVREWKPEDIAAFAPRVIRAAENGDTCAGELLRRGAAALAELVAGAAAALHFPDGPDVVLLGGCARSGPPYQALVESAIGRACPRARIVPPQYSTTYGAALNALHAGGIPAAALLMKPGAHPL